MDRRRRPVLATRRDGLADGALRHGAAAGRGDALPRGLDPGTAGQPARGERPRPLRPAGLGPSADDLRAVTLRGPAPERERADPVDEGPAPDRGRPGRVEAGRSDRPVRLAHAAHRAGRTGDPVPHPAALSARDRERRRRVVRHDRAADVLPVVCLVPAARPQRPAPLERQRVHRQGPPADVGDRVELRRVPGRRADRSARRCRSVVAHRLSPPAPARRRRRRAAPRVHRSWPRPRSAATSPTRAGA